MKRVLNDINLNLNSVTHSLLSVAVWFENILISAAATGGGGG